MSTAKAFKIFLRFLFMRSRLSRDIASISDRLFPSGGTGDGITTTRGTNRIITLQCEEKSPRLDHDEATIRQLYDRFNARDVAATFSLIADDVAWANGMDGTHVHGNGAIREYRAYQWSVIGPLVEPQTIRKADDGSLVVDVQQVVKNLDGRILIDELVTHAVRIESGRVERFDIQGDTQLTGIHVAT